MRRRESPALPAVLASLTLAGCLGGGEPLPAFVGGTGSETTNHIAGRAVQDGQHLSEGARVALVPSGFHPLKDTLPGRMLDTTDGYGAFRLEKVAPGRYQVEICVGGYLGMAQVQEFTFTGGGLVLPPTLLQPPGTLSVILPDSLRQAGGFVFIPGTTYWTTVGEARSISLVLPAMRVPLVAYAPSVDSPWIELGRDLAILPAEDTELDLSGSGPPKGEAVFRLDTTPTGADVAENVAGFPLLVRLDASNFDFPAADTSTLTFRKPDGRILPHEVERWDRAAAQAEVWVGMDTVHGNSALQELHIRWGDAGGMPVSGSFEVFPSQDGFQGAWHLGESEGARRDATGNGRDGIPRGTDGDEQIQGMIGWAHTFDGMDDVLDVGVINIPRSITLSAWIRWEGAQAGELGGIIRKAAGPDRVLPAYGLRHGSGPAPTFDISDTGASLSRPLEPLPAGEWALVHGTYDGLRIIGYVNGRQVASTVASLDGNLVQNSLPTLIGAAGPGGFAGGVDEVRVESVARSPAWIKLCFESQRAGQVLLQRIR